MAIDDITFTPQCIKYNGTIPTVPTTTPYTGTTTPYTGPSTTTTTTTTPAGETTTTTPAGETTTTTTEKTTTTVHAECAEFACYNEGSCKPQLGKPVCECQPGFNGLHCENKVPPAKKNKLGAILGGIFGTLAFIALIVIGYIYGLPKLRAARDASTSTRLLDSLPIGPITNPAYNATSTSDA
ncbi:unnamed protein product [Rotaria magnacalcarata]|nr:unnamed protein product [Rotaria magnacalcarata]